MIITEAVAKRVLSVVDAGLVRGIGEPIPGQMCVEAAVCFALDLPHGDQPECVSPALRALKIRLNDAGWSSDTARAAGLRRLAIAQLGSAGVLDEREFAKQVAELAIRKCVPEALRAAAKVQDKAVAAKLLSAADACEREGTRESALKARDSAAAYAASDTAASAAYAASDTAAYAAAYASDTAAAYAAYAASAAAYAAAYASDTAYAAAYASDTAAAYAAAYASYAASSDSRDKSLASFCEAVVQILVKLNAPGCQWLVLTQAQGKP